MAEADGNAANANNSADVAKVKPKEDFMISLYVRAMGKMALVILPSECSHFKYNLIGPSRSVHTQAPRSAVTSGL
jgi:hypothetical protein